MRDVRISSWTVRSPSGRRALWIVLSILLVLVGAWLLYLRAHSTPAAVNPRGFAGQPMPVATAVAKQGDIDIVYNALGTVTPLATATVKTQINGQLTQIAFTEGQTVQKGDLLAVIDPRPYELALAQAEGQLIKDQALLKQAQTDLSRYQTLLKQDSIAEQTVATQAALVEQYRGTVKSDQGLVDNAKLNIAYCHVVAPFTGKVGLRQVDLGNYVTANDANGLVVLTEVQPITVVFSLPEDDLQSIIKQLNAGATLQATAYDRANTTKLAAGKLVSVDNQIDTTTGTFKLRAQFDNQDGVLFPNQFVNIRLLVDTLHNATLIPAAAVQRGAPGTFVYAVQPDSTVSVTPIKTGTTQGETVAVQSGIAVGTQIVVDGADKLRDKAKIVLRQENPPGAAMAPAAAPGEAAGVPADKPAAGKTGDKTKRPSGAAPNSTPAPAPAAR